MVWIDGSVTSENEARISPFDHGLLTGDGVFETMRVYGGVPFAARRHLERLGRSAAGLDIALPSPELLRAGMDEVIAANHLEEGRLRITVTAGPAPLGSERGPHGPTVIMAAGPMPEWPASTDVFVVPWPRNERGALAGIKTVSYGENVVALAWARRRGGGEALFANLVGDLCEGTGSNVFVGVGGRLITPPLSSGCLAGVTRDLIIEECRVEEADLAVDRLAGVEEAFLTSSTREVQPIAAIDGRPLGATPGPLTTSVMAAFADLLSRHLDP